VESQIDYRAGTEALGRKLAEAGTDTARLLEWVREPSREALAGGAQMLLLERVFKEQFEVIEKQAAPKAKGGLRSERVQNPHDPQATYAAKGEGSKKKEHVGYKVQVAETVTQAELAAGEPTQNFITGIVTHAAHESDEAGAEKMEAEQAAMGLDKPPVTYVDGAYVSAQKLAQAQAEGRTIMGPAALAPRNNGGRFTSEDFAIDVEQRQATCPAGQPNTQCSRLEEKESGQVTYRFEWSTHCAHCPLRERCVGPEQKHRSLVVGEYHSVLQARRREQQTESFAREMKHRNGIEGTQSELVRGHGMRRARYRGLAKVRLQNYLIGAACNIKRWLRRKAWQLQQAAAVSAPAVS
jgi:transposase